MVVVVGAGGVLNIVWFAPTHPLKLSGRWGRVPQHLPRGAVGGPLRGGRGVGDATGAQTPSPTQRWAP